MFWPRKLEESRAICHKHKVSAEYLTDAFLHSLNPSTMPADATETAAPLHPLSPIDPEQLPKVVLNWAARKGVAVIPASTNIERQRQESGKIWC